MFLVSTLLYSIVAAGQGWQDQVEAAATFFSVHVGVAAMAACSIAQRRIAERAAFLRSSAKAVGLSWDPYPGVGR